MGAVSLDIEFSEYWSQLTPQQDETRKVLKLHYN
jgi:hypothetical protein